MKLPNPLKERFKARTTLDPLVVVKSLYDLDGNLGETCLASDGSGLAAYSRRLGGDWLEHWFALEDLEEIRFWGETSFSYFHYRDKEGSTRTLKFSPWEAARLGRLAELWEKATGKQAGNGKPGIPSSASAPDVAPSVIDLTPLIAFCSGIHAVIESDDEVHPLELSLLSQRVPDQQAIQSGASFLTLNGVDGLMVQLKNALDDRQRECLLVNVLDVEMVDGLLQSEEQTMVDRFVEALEVSEERYEHFKRILLTKNNLSVLSGAATNDPSPLVAFCASLQATIKVDEHSDNAEFEYLLRLVNDAEACRQGVDYLMQQGLDALLARLPQILNEPQKSCLMANLIQLMMENGELTGAEQNLISRFQDALGIGEQEQYEIFEVLLLGNNMTVFRT